MEKQCFIKSSDADTIQQLLKLGFQVLAIDNGVYTFLNDGELHFDASNSKIVYSNALTI